MKPLPKILLSAYLQALHAKTVPTSEQAHYQKWLRFYLDFCMKYRHPPRDRESLAPCLQKLASKNQLLEKVLEMEDKDADRELYDQW